MNVGLEKDTAVHGYAGKRALLGWSVGCSGWECASSMLTGFWSLIALARLWS